MRTALFVCAAALMTVSTMAINLDSNTSDISSDVAALEQKIAARNEEERQDLVNIATKAAEMKVNADYGTSDGPSVGASPM